ncbi:MAG TPA: hypothetical protein H9866_02230 [Candidatus Tidjanibacter gallistercoris]|nr:hypothetical protein [Candidatus Tidjanibacter gallistercoris]
MRLKYILLSAMACAVVLFAGCKQSQPGINVTPKEFEKKTTEGVYKVAKAQYAFNKTKDQLYFNRTTNTFRIVSDDGTKYVEVVLDSPVGSVGEKVKATVRSKGIDGVDNYDSIELEIRKKEGEKCWLWNQANTFGVLMFYVQ